VGNDVVDLQDAANAGKSGDSRFLKKILTDAEIEMVKSAANPDALLWSFWACKETAYKVMKKKSPDSPFIPGRWQVVIHKKRTDCWEGEVIVGGKDGIPVRLFPGLNYVCCVGAENKAVLNKLIQNVYALPDGENISPSRFARRCIRRTLAQSYGWNFDAIQIRRKKWKQELQPPAVFLGGQKTNIDLSISHDGRFVAYAYCQNGDASPDDSHAKKSVL